MDKKIKQLEKEIKTLKLQLQLFAKWTKETSANIDFNSYAQIENIIDNKINSNIQNIGDELEEILQMNNEQLNNEL
tara:strand:- start:748 stop:975 length:228 start_codon:yes stop_codon:yes gene_type:complete